MVADIRTLPSKKVVYISTKSHGVRTQTKLSPLETQMTNFCVTDTREWGKIIVDVALDSVKMG